MRVFILICLLAALGCTKKDAEPTPAAETETTDAPAPEAAEDAKADPKVAEPLGNPNEPLEELPPELQGETPALDAPAKVTLLQAGGDAKQPLRYAFESGSKQQVMVDVGFGIDAIVSFLAIDRPLYVVTFTLATEVETVSGDGTAKVAFEVVDVKTDLQRLGDEKRRKMVAKGLKDIRNTKGSYTLSPRGQISNMKLRFTDQTLQGGQDLADNLRLALLQLTPALPEEPVGAGAKWTAHAAILQGGAQVNELRTFELKSAAAGTAELGVTLLQNATEHEFEKPGSRKVMTLTGLKGDGAGTLSWSSGSLLPTKADVKWTVLHGALDRLDASKAKDGRPQAIEIAVQTERTASIGASN